MKKHFLLIALIACLALALYGCDGANVGETVKGSGNVTTEERAVSGVERVVVANQGDLTIQLGKEESLVIEAEDNLLPYIETMVTNGKLVFNTKTGINLKNTKPIRYLLTVKAIDGVEATSSGNIALPAIDGIGSFRISISSSGNVYLTHIVTNNLTVEISSSGMVTIGGGQARGLGVFISSSGDLRASEVEAKFSKVELSSSGSAYVWVTDSLDGSLSSSGNIYYTGDPEVNVDTSSSGKAVKQD